MIPRILHQTSRDVDIPRRLRGDHESWRRHHPGWDFRLRTDAECYRPRRWLEPHTAHVIRMAITVLDDHVGRRAATRGDVKILPHDRWYPSTPTDRIARHRIAIAHGLRAYGVHHDEHSWR